MSEKCSFCLQPCLCTCCVRHPFNRPSASAHYRARARLLLLGGAILPPSGHVWASARAANCGRRGQPRVCRESRGMPVLSMCWALPTKHVCGLFPPNTPTQEACKNCWCDVNSMQRGENLRWGGVAGHTDIFFDEQFRKRPIVVKAEPHGTDGVVCVSSISMWRW